MSPLTRRLRVVLTLMAIAGVLGGTTFAVRHAWSAKAGAWSAKTGTWSAKTGTWSAKALAERLGLFAGSPESPTQVYICPMHPDVRSDKPGRCPECGMELIHEDPASSAETHAGAHGSRAESTSPAVPGASEARPDAASEPRAPVAIDARRQQLLGVRTVSVAFQRLGREVRAAGVIRQDETAQTEISVKVDGWVEQLFVDYTGRPVRRGEALFTLYSPELVAAQREYLLALTSRDRVSAGAGPDARALADGMVSAARERLRLWDLTDAHIAALERSGEPSRTITVPSPVGGVVMEKPVVQGMRVAAGQPLYRVVDLSHVWLEADVYEGEVALLRRGTRAAATLEALPGERFDATLTFVAPLVDQVTRTVRARFELPNRSGRLRPGMFGAVHIKETPREVLALPADALLDTGQRQIVFVSEGEGYFAPRDVRVGTRMNGHVEILDGLRAGDVVASSALFFIDSESQIRGALEGYDAPPQPGGEAGAVPGLRIEMTSEPDPPKAGNATFIVTVRDASGQPLTDADVSLVLYMPAMPSMNMPAMKSDGRLSSAGNGTYSGIVDVMMSGRWDATITVTRRGARLGSRQLTLVAR